MNPTRILTIALVACALALAACGDDDESSDESAATAATTTEAETTATEQPKPKPEPSEKPGIEIATADSEFGTVLFDGDDQAIYLFDKETSDTSECYGECAAAWPPVITDGEPQAGNGADDKLLGTTERDDGATQVTYNGHPLYYYVDDGPGQILCHDVVEFGGLWLVVDPEGNAVQ